jgi:hypothetical protein
MSEAHPTTDLVLGKFYRVPAVLVSKWWEFHGWLPVIGPKHEDAEFVNFPWEHFHIDWRFAPERVWRSHIDWPTEGSHFGSPIQCPDRRGERIILQGPELRRMKYKRAPGPFPVKRAKWLPAMQERFACAKLVNGACPHRGIPVSAMHRDGDVLTCPGHGLRWNAVTGELHV